MGFSRQECCSGLPCPPPGDLPDPGIKPVSLASPALAGSFFTPELPGKPWPERRLRFQASSCRNEKCRSCQRPTVQSSTQPARRVFPPCSLVWQPQAGFPNFFHSGTGLLNLLQGSTCWAAGPGWGLFQGDLWWRLLTLSLEKEVETGRAASPGPEKERAGVAVRGCHPLRGVEQPVSQAAVSYDTHSTWIVPIAQKLGFKSHLCLLLAVWRW